MTAGAAVFEAGIPPSRVWPAAVWLPVVLDIRCTGRAAFCRPIFLPQWHVSVMCGMAKNINLFT